MWLCASMNAVAAWRSIRLLQFLLRNIKMHAFLCFALKVFWRVGRGETFFQKSLSPWPVSGARNAFLRYFASVLLYIAIDIVYLRS